MIIFEQEIILGYLAVSRNASKKPLIVLLNAVLEGPRYRAAMVHPIAVEWATKVNKQMTSSRAWSSETILSR